MIDAAADTIIPPHPRWPTASGLNLVTFVGRYVTPSGYRNKHVPFAQRTYDAAMLHDVTDEDTAIALGSGDVPVLGTPRLVAWLEAATVQVAAGLLDDGRTTVGTAIRVKHRRPTAVGGTIGCTAEVLSGPDEKGRLTFSVRAVDGEGQVAGEGEIDRVVVERDAFGS